MITSYNAMFSRKSVRKYAADGVSEDQLQMIRRTVSETAPLFPEMAYDWQILSGCDVQGQFNVRAPFYLSFSSEDAQDARMNLGFIFQQMDLFFSANGLGSCWLGFTRPKEPKLLKYPFQASLAFGIPAEPLHRDRSQFRRRAVSEISIGEDKRLEAASLAPSAHNTQPWYFLCRENRIHCFQPQPSLITNLFLKKLLSVDMGIALCHLAVASAHFGLPFRFERIADPPQSEKGIYLGTC